MVIVERKDYSSDALTDLNMQLLSRNVVGKIAHNVKQLSKVMPSRYVLPSRSAYQKTTSLIPNLCNAQIHRTFESASEFCKNGSNPQNLPHYPVPPLKETLEKFLKTATVHLTQEELAEATRLIKEFEKGEGAKLQALLEKTAANEENWLAKRWLKVAYLTYRDPVTVFSSPGMAFPTQKFNSDDEYLNYAAQVTFAALSYKHLIDNNKLPVEKMGKQELDMSQYKKIFGTCRIPHVNADLHSYNPDSKHIVVAHKNHFFKIPAYSNSGKVLHVATIMKIFKSITESDTSAAVPVGVLTTDGRDPWSVAYEELKHDFQNKRSIDSILKSLFVVCLDQEVPIIHGKNDMTVTSEQLIHGGGVCHNAGNRWMDKTIQIVVNRNGVNGLCYEHSPAEGQPIAIMTDYILNCIQSGKLNECPGEGEEYDTGSRLSFVVNDVAKCSINEAAHRVEKLASNLEMEVLHYTCYGKEFIKSHKLSPDSYIQIAMQYAFLKLHKVPGAQYESAHLRMFVDGRTETIRSCSEEAISFACSMLVECTDEERVQRLKAAVKGHRDFTLMALNGKGVDRHLLGLKLMALENNLPVPEFFNSPAVTRSAHFRVSTSQVASKHLAFMCYGPLVDDGYGCCYNPRANDILFAISSWKSNSETSSVAFRNAMVECLDSMHELLVKAGEKPKSKL